MSNPRASRLVRAADLRSFRAAAISLACSGGSLDARDRLVVVPTRAAAAHLVCSIENRLGTGATAVVLPDLVLPDELVHRFAERLTRLPAPLTGIDREVLLSVACRRAKEEFEPPFRIRPGLLAEILRFYDALRRHEKDVATFERLALGILEPGADHDRGAARLVQQTRFLAAAFRYFEELCSSSGRADEHMLRRYAIQMPAERPWRHVVLAVGDESSDLHGLCAADWDFLARVPGLEQLDVAVTDTMLAGGFHERIHRWLPGIEEERVVGEEHPGPVVVVRGRSDVLITSARDREEEVAGFARWVRDAVRSGEVTALARMALVVRQPLPYVYVAREVFRSARIPCQTFDALPLAAEPFAAALETVLATVTSNFARVPAISLLRSPHFRFTTSDTSEVLTTRDVAVLDRALREAGYLGDLTPLERLVETWRAAENRALRAGGVLLDIARALLPLRSSRPPQEHLSLLLDFLASHAAAPAEAERRPAPDDPLRPRHLRARSAIVGTLVSLREAFSRFDRHPADFDDVAALVRRQIEVQTFAPRTGNRGVHLVDAESVRFADLDAVQLAGLVEGEWPERPRRNIFYSPGLLRELGWPSESQRLEGVRAAFADLLRLPANRLVVSTFMLENDAIVSPSGLIDDLDGAKLEVLAVEGSGYRVFEHELLGLEPSATAPLSPAAQAWAERRLEAPPRNDPRFRGATSGPGAEPWSVSALERYQDCPFKFFAANVLRLEELPEDDPVASPRARGRFVHEVFQRFFEEWNRRGGPIALERIEEAKALFREVAAPLLARLPDAEAALERARLLGSAISVGIVDTVLGLEASRSAAVRGRLLEHRFEGEFSLGSPDGHRIPLRGVADRIDLLDGHRLRVIDYKSGSAPNVKRALQVPIYALCAQELLASRDGHPWTVDEAAYVAFSGRRSFVPVVKSGQGDAAAVLESARLRLLHIVDGINRGEFPARPHDPNICNYCDYPSVCRKDYIEDDDEG